MNNQSNSKHLYSITMMKPIQIPHLFLLMIVLILLAAAGDSYTPVEDITVKCGYSGHLFNQYDNRNWSGDINSKFSPIEAGANTSVFREAPHGSFDNYQVPYTTARLSLSEFTYRFKLSAGQKFIRLYFNPASYNNFDRSKAVFSVKAAGFTLLKDFNASVNADAGGVKTLYREFCLNIEEGQSSLNITFTPSRSEGSQDVYAFINGIEIVSMPTNLYYTAPESTYGIEYVGKKKGFRVENSTAMEMVYRINIGGSSLSFNQDTGMYRNWDGEAYEISYLDYLSLMWSVLPQNVSLELNFATKPEYSAPKQVYQTGRSMGMNNSINKSYNLTWEFPVDSMFFYLVRLHFCEFESAITSSGDRRFLIYIANLTAEEGWPGADIIAWSGGNGIPVYKDYYVFMPAGPGGSQKKVNLSIALQANPNTWMTKYTDAILNGLEIFKLNNSVGILAGPNPDPPPAARLKAKPSIPEKSNTNSRTRTRIFAIISGLVISSTLALFSVLWLLVLIRRRRKVKESARSSHGKTNSTNTHGSSLPSELCRYFSLTEIKAATQDFDDLFIIGVGGFGHVYKGYIDGGDTPVAIKRRNLQSSQGAREFKTEIEMLSQLRHRNLVPLIGYCVDESEMILVYDFMNRGTLSDHLHHNNNPPLLWEQRLEICIGAARGLHYLHTGAQCIIIHRDVKSTNILLDEKWTAKVSDFGLSKMGTTTVSNTQISTVVKGSFGYMDPEYYRRQQLTEKSDVNSFGVVLCEVLCGRPAVIRTVENRHISLAQLVKNSHHQGEVDGIIDPCLMNKIRGQCLSKFVDIAMSCMQDNGIKRPSMYSVVRGLEFVLQLQRSTEDDMVNNISRIEWLHWAELCFVNDKEQGFSCERSCANNDSIKRISQTIFSEINNPDGR